MRYPYTLTGGQDMIPPPPKKYSLPYTTIPVCLKSDHDNVHIIIKYINTTKSILVLSCIRNLPYSIDLFSCIWKAKIKKIIDQLKIIFLT